MKYSLRSLMIVAILGPPLLAVAWFQAIEMWQTWHWIDPKSPLGIFIIVGVAIAAYRILAAFYRLAR